MKIKKTLAGILTAALALSAIFPISALATDADDDRDTTTATTLEDADASADESADAAADSAEEEAAAPEEKFVFTQISIDHNMVSLVPGGHVKLVASYYLPAGVTGNVVWESSDTDIAWVTTDGRVYAAKTGNAVIYASIGSIKAECRVHVTIDPLPYDGPVTSAARRGFTKVVDNVVVGSTAVVSEVDLSAWSGSWNSVVPYLAADDVVDGLQALEEDGEMEEGSLVAGFNAMFDANFASLKVEDNTVTFYDADGEVISESEYKFVEVVGEGDSAACVFEATAEDAAYKYLMLYAPEVDESGETFNHFHAVYGDDLEAMKESSDWYPTLVATDTTDAQVLAGLTAFLAE